MEATRRIEIELSEQMAQAIQARVESGEFASASEVVIAGLQRLAERERAEEAWLRTTISDRAEALENGRMSTKTADELRSSLASRLAERDQAA
jgi:antitoxin ParD1/3/4